MKPDYVDLRNSSTSLSIFNPDHIINKDLLSILLDYELGDVLDYGAGNSPWQDSLNYKTYKRADILQNQKKNIDIIIPFNGILPVPDESYDSILLMDVLEHIPNTDLALSEIFRMLRKDGSLFISLPFIYREHETPFDFFRFTSFGVSFVLEVKGFKLIDSKKIGNHLLTCYSMWNEAIVKNNEKVVCSPLSKISRRLFNSIILPLLNLTIFRLPVRSDDSIYHHLFVVARK